MSLLAPLAPLAVGLALAAAEPAPVPAPAPAPAAPATAPGPPAHAASFAAVTPKDVEVKPGARSAADVAAALRGVDLAPCARGIPSGAAVVAAIAIAVDGGVREAKVLAPQPGGSLSDVHVACVTQALAAARFAPHGAEQVVQVRLRVESDQPVIRGSLDKDIIRRVVQQNAQGIRACYESAFAKKPDLGDGKVVLKWTVAGDGRVAKTEAVSVAAGFEPVSACMQAAVAQWRFPKPKGGGVVVISYPFAFRQSFSVAPAAAPK